MIPSKYRIDAEHFEPAIATKDKYSVSELRILGLGDILLLYTDALTEQKNGTLNFCDTRLEHVLREAKEGTAKDQS